MSVSLNDSSGKPQGKQQRAEAEAAIHRLLRQNPGRAELHNMLGALAVDDKRFDVAIEAFQTAAKLDPVNAGYLSNLAEVLRVTGRRTDAIDALKRASQLEPGRYETYFNLGVVLTDEHRLDEAIDAYRHALALEPGLVEAHSNLIICLLYDPNSTASAIARELGQWNRQHAAPLAKLIKPHENDQAPTRRLKIGYVSADLSNHPVGCYLFPLLANHDRANFEVVAYSSGTIVDGVTRQLRSLTDQWHDLVGVPDEKAAALIRSHKIDILVDLGLHTANNRLLVFARKPAPIQVTWGGYPGSTGLDAIDYRLSDPYLDPPDADDSMYAEKTIRLPHSFWCFPHRDGLEVNPPPHLENGFITFGCLNNFRKMNATIFRVWIEIMRKTAGSRLLLLGPKGDARPWIESQLTNQGIDPSRIELLPNQQRADYLKYYHRIDISLDSFPYNGHTTSLDSFWMGVPLVSLMGQTIVSRAGWSLLSNLGMPELVARSTQQMVQIAVDLANDSHRLQQLRATFRARLQGSPLADARGFARDIENVYRRIWVDSCAAKRDGLQPPRKKN